ncbi:MAG: response regulator [Gammaproteobacteria bacterium]|nr:response regulator [Gammaproteobacteria bacterium]MDH5729593.1 response regulator [Gammaproteobacteria bacterium]
MLSKDAKILIVDDMKLIRTAMRKHLNRLGYMNVIEAVDGQDAVEKHASEHPGLIFMDVVMPKMTGSEALKQIRKTDQQTPIVMLSSVADETVVDECEEQGILGYVTKPVTDETGPWMIGDLLEQAG